MKNLEELSENEKALFEKYTIALEYSNPFLSDEERRKKALEMVLQKREKANSTVKNFGSSDCKCKGHLHWFKTKRDLMHAIEKVSA